MRFPPPLEAGARVALVAPAGPLRDQADLDGAIANVRSFGWEPVVGQHVLERHGYLAGGDAHRLADLNAAARDATIDAVWCIRGGYGAMRLLDDLDYDAWRARPTALIGYSDITALHAAINRRAGLVTFHGPTARASFTPMTTASFRDALSQSPDFFRPVSFHDAVTLRPGRARGRLVGGNLALVSALAGTPYAWNLDGAILVLEDVSESVYRLDRMLTQLWLTGTLRGAAGLVFGRFTEIPDDAANADRPLERLLEEVAARCGVPALRDFPVGHIENQVTLPLGAVAELDAGARTLTITRD